MLSGLKLKMFTKAVQIKMSRGEELETILAQYTALSEEEKGQLREAVKGAAESN